MKKIKSLMIDNANKINIGIGVTILLSFTALCITLIKMDKEIG